MPISYLWSSQRASCVNPMLTLMDTERPSPRYSGIDVWDPVDVLDAMIGGQFAAVAAAVPKTIGIVVVAALAASAATPLFAAAITATRSRTRSATNSGSIGWVVPGEC
jgi:hypothetical protein